MTEGAGAGAGTSDEACLNKTNVRLPQNDPRFTIFRSKLVLNGQF